MYAPHACGTGAIPPATTYSINFLINMATLEAAAPALAEIAPGIYEVVEHYKESPQINMAGLRFAGVLCQHAALVPGMVSGGVVRFIKVGRPVVKALATQLSAFAVRTLRLLPQIKPPFPEPDHATCSTLCGNTAISV